MADAEPASVEPPATAASLPNESKEQTTTQQPAAVEQLPDEIIEQYGGFTRR